MYVAAAAGGRGQSGDAWGLYHWGVYELLHIQSLIKPGISLKIYKETSQLLIEVNQKINQ